MKNKKIAVVILLAVFVVFLLIENSPSKTGKWHKYPELFRDAMDHCLAYDGKVYFMYKGMGISSIAYPYQKADEITPDMIPEGFVYVGELERQFQAYYFYKDSMVYMEYSRDTSLRPGFYCPRSPGKAILYYNAQKDQCMVLFSESELGDADGVVWFERDDDRMGYDMIS